MAKRYFPRIRHLHWCTDQAMSDALAKMDLTASQGCAMAFISHQKQPPLARDFEQAYHLSHSCAAGIFSRLEKKEFIEFRTEPEDKRCKRIYVLPKGEQCHQHMHVAIASIEERMVQGFTEAEKEQFLALLDRAITNMDTPCRCRKKEEET